MVVVIILQDELKDRLNVDRLGQELRSKDGNISQIERGNDRIQERPKRNLVARIWKHYGIDYHISDR